MPKLPEPDCAKRKLKQYEESNTVVLEDIQTKLVNKEFGSIQGADLGARNAMGIVVLDTKDGHDTKFLLSNKMDASGPIQSKIKKTNVKESWRKIYQN